MPQTIFVPIDFTPVTEKALQFAVQVASKLKGQIVLLNLMKQESQKENASAMLEVLASKHRSESISIKHMVELGDIKNIGTLADENNASLIVMGTHGLKGIQYLVGSKAMKVVSHSPIPIIIVQAETPIKPIEEILVPLDFATEEKQILSVCAKIAEVLGARIHLMGAGHQDELLKQKVQLNLAFSKKYLKEKNVNFLTIMAPGQKDFQEELLHYAEMMDASLIAMINHHEDGYKNLLGSGFDQNIITNQLNIPVLIFSGKSLPDMRDIFGMFQ